MKSYARNNGKNNFDWHQFLKRAIANDIGFSEHREAVKLSESWVTCAVGNQCDSLPRNKEGAPMDLRLMGLGVLFNKHIFQYKYDVAISVLNEIEKRSTELILSRQ